MASARHNLDLEVVGDVSTSGKDLGGKVMRRPADVPEGQWGTTIVFWTPVTKTEKDAEGDEKTDRYFVMRVLHRLQRGIRSRAINLDHLRAGHG